MKAASVVVAVLLVGCGREPRVARVYNGQLVEGRFIAPEAYAAFLRGAIAEEAGDTKGALTAYSQAVDEDQSDPELEARIGETRCRLNPNDPAIDASFAKALKLDPNSASALAANARCEASRGRTGEAMMLANRAAAQDPTNSGLEAFAVKSSVSSGDPAVRERAIALTRVHGEHVASWDALIAWGRAHKDAELVVAGLEGLVRVAPTRSAEVEAGAVMLSQMGNVPLARKLAVAVSDAPIELGVLGPRDATVARLAVDEAISRADRPRTLTRATRGHVPLAEIAARALLLEHRDLATAFASMELDADPKSSGAQMVRAALSSKSSPLTAMSGEPPELCAMLYARHLATTSGPDAARAWLAHVTSTPAPATDPLLAPLAADLAAHGVTPGAKAARIGE